MVKNIGLYPRVQTDTAATKVVSQAGAVALVETVRAAGLDRGLSQALSRWRKPLARHDPGKILTDLSIALAVGGDCLADVAVLRAEPSVFGAVASDPTVSRLVDTLAADPDRALKAIDSARAAARAQVWAAAGQHSPDHGASVEDPVVIDIDATLVTAHSEKELAAPTFKRGFGFHPLLTFLDHGQDGTGEPLSTMLRKGNAGSNTAADHITVLKAAFAQLPRHRPGRRPGRSVLVRADGAGGTHELLSWLTGQRVQYSVGFTLPDTFPAELALLDNAKLWQPAYDGSGQIRDGAFVAEATGLLNLGSWPEGMRVIIRKERPHPGAQLRITDHDGNRVTAFATNTTRGQLADLELRHRRRARCEDRIRISKDTGLRNLPLHDFDQNRIWLAIVALAVELTAWLQLLAFTDHPARRWEPKRLRLRLFSIAARIADHGRTRRLHLPAHAPWAQLLAEAIDRLQLIPAPC
ncbi:MAG: IS1380 family transposase [Actinomycetota bacterium]|nr:IS1380 family transposase [Actinomycetota bacterium]